MLFLLGPILAGLTRSMQKKKTDALAEEKTTMQKKKGYPAYLPRGSVFLFYCVCTIVKEHFRYGNVALPNNSVQCFATTKNNVHVIYIYIYIYIHIDKLLPAQLLARIIMVPYGRGMEGVRTMWIYVRSTLYLFMFLSQALAKVVLSEELVLIYI